MIYRAFRHLVPLLVVIIIRCIGVRLFDSAQLPGKKTEVLQGCVKTSEGTQSKLEICVDEGKW